MGGAGMTLAMVESSSGAASASATNAAMMSGVAGRISIPPTTVSSACSRNWKRVATPARSMNILIVDDSATMRAVLQRIIRLTGIEVERIFEARNGREALKVLDAESVQWL